MTAAHVAQNTTVGLMLVRDGSLTWSNDAADALVEPFGGGWNGAGSVLTMLRGVPHNGQRVAVQWHSPHGATRWWQVTCTSLGGIYEALLYEIVDETAWYDADGRDLGPPTAQWRLSRLEEMAGMGSWVWHVPDDTIEWSEALLKMFALPPGTRLDYPTYRSLVHPDDIDMIESRLAEAMRTISPFEYTHRMMLGDRVTERIFECHGDVFAGPDGEAIRVLGTARDITEERRARQELAYLAEHDPLTGVANRRRLTARLSTCLRESSSVALLLIDIDNFKDVNDLLGHAVGDEVIIRVAGAVGGLLPDGAELGRLGGDEFAVVVPEGDTESGLDLALRLCDAAAAPPARCADDEPRVTISVGVAALSGGQSVESSLAQADLALYEAKNAGRNRVRLFAPVQFHQAARRVSVLQRVSDALDASGTDSMGTDSVGTDSVGMELDAQPIVDLQSGRTSRHELLIRLRDGQSPPLEPGDFLPAAEQTDLVLRLDRWVLRQAVTALSHPVARANDLHFEVNVSARSLEDDDLGRWILELLAGADVAPHRLGLEITETAAISNLPAARLLASRLTEAGCGFTLDDFGAGFASFSYLKNLPFTSVKIAGEFVRNLDSDRVDQAMVRAVVGVAGELGMRLVAEEVDRPELVTTLRELGVDDAQGFLLGRPRPLRERLTVERRAIASTA